MIAFLPARIGVFDAMLRALTLCVVLWLAAAAHGAEFVAPYVDTVKDVEMILELAGVGPGDYLIDLGAGDGRFVIGAAQRGALAHGVELEPALVERAGANAERAGVSIEPDSEIGDIFDADISMATVVTIYLFPEANIALRPKLLAELAPGTRLVSNSFHMGDWAPDARAQGRTSGGALLWIIPADASNCLALHNAPGPARLTIEQRYQRIDARMEIDGAHVPLESAVLRGDVLQCVAASGEVTARAHRGYGNDRPTDAGRRSHPAHGDQGQRHTMKTIGMLGGMSWESTALYYRLINEETRRLRGGLHSAPIALVSVDFQAVEQLQRTDAWAKLAICSRRGRGRSKPRAPTSCSSARTPCTGWRSRSKRPSISLCCIWPTQLQRVSAQRA